jgi:hypothetical protein
MKKKKIIMLSLLLTHYGNRDHDDVDDGKGEKNFSPSFHFIHSFIYLFLHHELLLTLICKIYTLNKTVNLHKVVQNMDTQLPTWNFLLQPYLF